MIRSEKEILLAVMPRKTLTDNELHTVLLEIEAIVNSRPLTDVPMEPNENTPLTPNHLLRVNNDVALSTFQNNEDDCYSRQRFRLVQFTADEFWKCWLIEYPRTVLTRSKWHEKRKNLKPGDIVLLNDTFSPRGKWPLGKIVKTFPNKYGNVRSVLLKTINGSLKRPTCKLCPIVLVEHTFDSSKS